MKEEYTSNLANGILSSDMLMKSLVTVEKQISKCAYNRAKWKNANSYSYDSWNAELKQWMAYRKCITDILTGKYGMDAVAIKDTVSSIDKKTIPQKTITEIVQMIKDGKYQLMK